MIRVSLSGLILGMAAMAATTSSTPVTFSKDVLPVLQKNCQSCHRPGEVAPMSFLNYKETRPWAKAIETAVLTKKMPPWFADSKYGHFQNERKLTEGEINTLVTWSKNGAPEGNASAQPAPLDFVEGWNIRPDKVLTMPQPFEVPATGTIDYYYIVIPGGFDKDTWVTAAEVRPGNRAVMHHVIAFVRPPGSQWMKDAKPGVPFLPVVHKRDDNGAQIQEPVRAERKPAPAAGADPQNTAAGLSGTEFLVGYAPGMQPQRFDLGGGAKLIPAGSDVVLQLHYTANGKAATDVTKIGLVLAKEPPQHRYITMNAPTHNLDIPPGDPNYETHSSITLQDTAELVWLMPHMHLRGKDFTFRAVYPTGESETLLNVPKFDFNWQLGYEEAKPIVLPKGTRIECTAHFDNSPNNPANPNPKVEVRWGDQSWEEMMIGWFAVVIDAKTDPAVLHRAPRSSE